MLLIQLACGRPVSFDTTAVDSFESWCVSVWGRESEYTQWSSHVGIVSWPIAVVRSSSHSSMFMLCITVHVFSCVMMSAMTDWQGKERQSREFNWQQFVRFCAKPSFLSHPDLCYLFASHRFFCVFLLLFRHRSWFRLFDSYYLLSNRRTARTSQ